MASGQPVRDGFESGDYRNFAPVYLGTQTDWIRPTATVTDANPIAGEYSLRWRANEDPHRWALLSNAFPLSHPIDASVTVRVDGPSDEPYAAGIGIAETQSRAAVVRATDSGLELTTDTWDGEPAATAPATLGRDDVYDLSIALEDGTLTATLADDEDERARLTAETTIEPNAIGLYVDTVADGETTLTFDDVAVASAPTRFRSMEWTRSSPFVVLPRAPDVGEDQGNWVGAPSVIDKGDRYRMWYRIRNSDQRGAGYGLAESEDGIEWEKADANPILVPDHGQNSNEGITVLRVDGTYHAWYTIDKDGSWHIVYATSGDGIEWDDHGVAIEGYCKDPVAVYVDGTFFLYAIAPTRTEFGVYTSDDGRNWNLEATYDLGSHGHPGAYYDAEAGTFHLYAFAEEGSASPVSRVRRAVSTDGIHFEPFESVWQDPPVGLDYRPTGGIDYGAFPGDEHGQLPHSRRRLMYYQARHDYHNNRPGWKQAGDGLVVLAGRFDGLFEGVPTTVDGRGYAYHEFPMEPASIPNIDIGATEPTTVTVERWDPEGQTAHGWIETTAETTLTVTASGLDPNGSYAFRVGDLETGGSATADGTATFELTVPDSLRDEFELTPK
ncbi:hypothetical protein [Halomontanus rarus]|uniref:hypothetical protein n=1 Tax=Halomontanus rarus TaxID=3034020 RepID=UPI0023E79D77|nr:hypothetical protein [Halovivax sp. TS33]